ncbi:MAG: recombinase family protein [Pontixanthobacter sp.]
MLQSGPLERPAQQVGLSSRLDPAARLADFAKIVELLDAKEASFVSVTQAFNTTSSMGRLTLNVLLSFAQFEREVTAERIRDKIAASTAKGIWMGGTQPASRATVRHPWPQDDRGSCQQEEAALSLLSHLSHRFGAERPAIKTRAGKQTKMVVQAAGAPPIKIDCKLVKLLGEAIAVREMLIEGMSLNGAAEAIGSSPA